jgi:hypothetical protein
VQGNMTKVLKTLALEKSANFIFPIFREISSSPDFDKGHPKYIFMSKSSIIWHPLKTLGHPFGCPEICTTLQYSMLQNNVFRSVEVRKYRPLGVHFTKKYVNFQVFGKIFRKIWEL